MLSIIHHFPEQKDEEKIISGNEPGIQMSVFKSYFSKNIENKNKYILSNIFWAFNLDFEN